MRLLVVIVATAYAPSLISIVLLSTSFHRQVLFPSPFSFGPFQFEWIQLCLPILLLGKPFQHQALFVVLQYLYLIMIDAFHLPQLLFPKTALENLNKQIKLFVLLQLVFEGWILFQPFLHQIHQESLANLFYRLIYLT